MNKQTPDRRLTSLSLVCLAALLLNASCGGEPVEEQEPSMDRWSLGTSPAKFINLRWLAPSYSIFSTGAATLFASHDLSTDQRTLTSTQNPMPVPDAPATAAAMLTFDLSTGSFAAPVCYVDPASVLERTWFGGAYGVSGPGQLEPSLIPDRSTIQLTLEARPVQQQQTVRIICTWAKVTRTLTWVIKPHSGPLPPVNLKRIDLGGGHYEMTCPSSGVCVGPCCSGYRYYLPGERVQLFFRLERPAFPGGQQVDWWLNPNSIFLCHAPIDPATGYSSLTVAQGYDYTRTDCVLKSCPAAPGQTADIRVDAGAGGIHRTVTFKCKRP